MGGIQSTQDESISCFLLHRPLSLSSRVPILTASSCDDSSRISISIPVQHNKEYVLLDAEAETPTPPVPRSSCTTTSTTTTSSSPQRRRQERRQRVFDIYQTEDSTSMDDDDDDDFSSLSRLQLPFRKCSRSNCSFCGATPTMTRRIHHNNNTHNTDNHPNTTEENDTLVGLWIPLQQHQPRQDDIREEDDYNYDYYDSSSPSNHSTTSTTANNTTHHHRSTEHQQRYQYRSQPQPRTLWKTTTIRSGYE